MINPAPHIPVLLSETIDALMPPDRKILRAIDGTLGAGGHSFALLEAGVETVLAMDLDLDAIAIARQRLEPFQDRVHIVHDSYLHMDKAAQHLGWSEVDAILLDLGVSSMQLDQAERGFAFSMDGPLDMRFDPGSINPSAAEIVNSWRESELADIFYRYGEERNGRRIARAIIKARPFSSTSHLAEVIKEATPPARPEKGRPGKAIHPATRVFQALRIAVNDELTTIEKTLPRAIRLLKPGGRLAVISFHSLEDRIVKQVFKEASTEILSPPGMMLEEKIATVNLVTRKPIVANDDEIAQNPRSRSAKLRVVEKL